MRVSTSWIKSNLSRTISDREIIDALELAGIEVEQYTCSKPLDVNIVVGLVQNVRQHPEADRLNIASVYNGVEDFEVVCGASNVRAGILVPFAQVGAILPSGDTISEAKLRGIVSKGMLCSGRELGINEDHEGLLELSSGIVPGLPIAQLYPGDGYLDLKTQANRFDLLSVLGLSREVASQLDIDSASYTNNELVYSSNYKYIASTEASVSRIQFAEILVDPLKETPEWMVHRLTSAGVRSLGIVVDITNYVMLQYGQPLHAYDADQVSLPFSVRFAEKGEVFATLDNIERILGCDDLVIADKNGVLGLAGVMGGAKSEVGTITKRIYLEAASFDAGMVRKTAKRHGLRSEASARFERGLPIQLQSVALYCAVQLLIEHANAKFVAAEDKLNVFPYEYRIGLRASFATKMMGIELTREQIVVTLSRLGLESKPFDIVSEAKSHLGKPYKWGANFRQDRTEAFDCSYLSDYIYSLIGQKIGHTAAQQFEFGLIVELDQLRRGDLLFREGPWKKLKSEDRGGVSHVAMYIGGGKILEAADIVRSKGEWIELPLQDRKVVISDLSSLTEDGAFLGARRYVEDLSDFVSIEKAPWWRMDLRTEEDLLEELARTIGYEKIPATIPTWHPKSVEFDRLRSPKQLLRNTLTGLGLYEVMTYSFVSAESISKIRESSDEYLKLKNPLSIEQAYLRRNLLPSHLGVLEQNRKDFSEVAFYELSGVFLPLSKGELPQEPSMLGVTTSSSAEGYRYIKGIWDKIAAIFALDYQLVIEDHSPYASGRMARIMCRGKEIGRIGQINPAIVRDFKLVSEVGYLEVDTDLLFAGMKALLLDSESKFPSALRDVSVLLPLTAQWQKIDKSLNSIAGVSARYGGDYFSEDLPVGYRSLTVHLEISSATRTLTDSEVETVLSRIEQLFQNKFKSKSR